VESSFDSHHENLMRTAIRAPWWLLRRPTSGCLGLSKSISQHAHIRRALRLNVAWEQRGAWELGFGDPRDGAPSDYDLTNNGIQCVDGALSRVVVFDPCRMLLVFSVMSLYFLGMEQRSDTLFYEFWVQPLRNPSGIQHHNPG